MLKNPRPEIETLDDQAEWCAMPKEELQNNIAWCLKRFANFTDYVDHNQYSSHLNNANHIQYSAVAILVMSFQGNEQAVHTVRCTGSTRYRKHKPTRNDTVRLWMGTSLDSRFKSTAGCIPTWLKCLFVVEDVELSDTWLDALLQTFARWPICQTAGIVIVEGRDQPLLQPVPNGSHRHRPVFGVGTNFIVCISPIQCGIHPPTLTPQPDTTRWCLSNLIDLNPFNISKKHFCQGRMATSEWTRSVGAVRDTPVADHSAPRVNTTLCVAYHPPIAVSPFLLALSVSCLEQTLWRCGQLWP